MKIFSEEKMAPALVLFCLSHPLAPTQTALRQPLGSQTCEYPARTRGSSHPSSPASGRAMLSAAVKEGPGPQRLAAGPQQGGGRPAALRVCGLLGGVRCRHSAANLSAKSGGVSNGVLEGMPFSC